MDFLAALHTFDKAKLAKLFKRVIHKMAVFDIQHKAHFRKAFFAFARIDIMQNKNVENRYIRHPGRAHASNHPAVECVA